jgi:type IV pilus assembly protein PilA
MSAPKGISLIPLFVLLAIVAVIAAFAIPAWRSHRITAHLDEAVKAGEAAKLVVLEAAAMRGGLAQLKSGDLDYNAQSTASAYTAHVDISESGRVTIVTKGTGATPDPAFLLTPLEEGTRPGNTSLIWSCDVIAGSTQWIPPSCTKLTSLPAKKEPAQPTSS